MKKILFGIFAVVGLVAGDAYARCEYNSYEWAESGYRYGVMGNSVSVSHAVCKSEGGAGVKRCYIKCHGSTWKFDGATQCEDGYNLVEGKCVKPEPEASASAANASAAAEKKVVGCSCRNHVAGGACAEAGIVNKKCVPTKCPKTVTEKGKTYNAYMVRNGKGGAIQYYCHNDAICKSKGQVLNTWDEGGVTYTDKKCIAAPVVEAAKEETPAPVAETPAKAAETPAPVVEAPKATEPVAETPKEQAPAPVVEAVKEETPAPVAETPKAAAQVVEVTVSGTVVDQNNDPLTGAGIFAPGTDKGFTVASADATFEETIKVAENTELEISFVGCKAQKIKAAELNNKIVKLDCLEQLEKAIVKPCVEKELKKLNATSGTWSEEQERCIPSACNTPRYELEFAGTDMAQCVDQVGMPCFDCDYGADFCEYAMENGQFICKVMGCLMDDEKVENNKCVSRLGEDCTKDAKKTDKNVEAAELYTDFVSGEMFCRITKCKNGYKVNDDETKCIEMLQECTESQKSQHPNASKTGVKKGTETCIALDCACGYKLDNEKCVEQTERACTKDTKPKLPKNAKSAKMVCENGKTICKIDECDGVEFELKNNACVKITGDDCKSGDDKAIKTKLEKRNNTMVCVIKTCSKGYAPADDGLTCVQSEGECPAEQLAALDKNATKGELKKQKCIITECKDGFEPDNNKCVTISGSCKPEDKNATSGKRKFDAESNTEICVITGCVGGYDPSEDGTECVENADEQKKIDDAQVKYDSVKSNEQSAANKLLGAASMGAMGIGGMMVASSLSEQKSDADAERDMTAYLATFKCDYGAGMNIKGGETDIELPGASELIPLYAEYVALANDLKSRKAQLGLKAGIESEKILDSATTGLYDDVSSGISSGAYASLARALQNPDGEDAKKWAEQKDKTAKNLKAGAITAGVGAVIGVAGNVISKVVANKKYRALENLEKKISGGTAATARCPSQSTGTYPDCVCNSGKEYNANLNECRTCTGGQKIDNTDGYAKCVCMGNTPFWDAERSRCVARPKTCNNGFIKGADGECECPSDQGMQVKGGKCVIIETVARSLFSATDTSTATLDAGRMFKISSAEIQSDAQTALEEFAAGLKKEGLSDCEIAITGYTDPLGDETGNQRLSEKRAKAVKDYLETLSDYTDVVISTTSTGQGENNCTCGAGTIPQGQESDKEYKVCAGQVATYPVSGNSRYAPCRRVVIEASCKKVTVGEEYE